jgi:hypothetical protein
MTKDEAQRRRWTFYEAVNLEHLRLGVLDDPANPPIFSSLLFP